MKYKIIISYLLDEHEISLPIAKTPVSSTKPGDYWLLKISDSDLVRMRSSCLSSEALCHNPARVRAVKVARTMIRSSTRVRI